MKKKGILLTESFLFKAQLLESDGNGNIIARGQFGSADIPTANKRVYPRPLMERELSILQPKMVDNQVFGELDHPGDGTTKLQRVSHLITKAELQDDGLIIGEAVILPDTRNGKQLMAILKNGGKVGVSSRGFGSVQSDADGNDVVQDDFQLLTWDFVADPAAAGSYPEFTTESKKDVKVEIKISEEDMAKKKDNEDLQTEALKIKEQEESDKESVKEQDDAEVKDKDDEAGEPEDKMEAFVAKIRKEESEKAVAKLNEMIEGLREKISEDVRSELESDPKIAGAKLAIENVKAQLRPYIIGEDISEEINSRDTQITEMKQSLDAKDAQLGEYAGVTKELGYKLRVEQCLNDRDYNAGQKKEIRQRVGDVTRFESLKQLDTKLGTIVKSVKEQEDRYALKIQQKESTIKKLESKIKDLSEGYETAIKTAEKFGIRAYMEQKLAGNPAAIRIKKIVESRGLTQVAEIDSLVEQFRSLKTPGSNMKRKIQNRFKVDKKENLVEGQVEKTLPKKGKSEELIEGSGFTMDDAVELSKLGEDLK